MNEEQARYAIKCIECQLAKKRQWQFTDEEKEDIKAYCLESIVKKWEHYDQAKSAWKTYMNVIVQSALADALKNYWCHIGRYHYEPLPEEVQDASPNDGDVLALIDDLLKDPVQRRMMRMRWEGENQNTICKVCRCTFDQYNQAKEILYKALKERMAPWDQV